MHAASDSDRSKRQVASDDASPDVDATGLHEKQATGDQHDRPSNDGGRPVQVLVPAELPVLTADGALALLRLLRKVRQRTAGPERSRLTAPAESKDYRREAA
jgi:hypothetical protein